VDAYEAMIGGRPYRAAISHDEAIAEMRRQAGVRFDPEQVEMLAVLFPPASHGHRTSMARSSTTLTGWRSWR